MREQSFVHKPISRWWQDILWSLLEVCMKLLLKLCPFYGQLGPIVDYLGAYMIKQTSELELYMILSTLEHFAWIGQF